MEDGQELDPKPEEQVLDLSQCDIFFRGRPLTAWITILSMFLQKAGVVKLTAINFGDAGSPRPTEVMRILALDEKGMILEIPRDHVAPVSFLEVAGQTQAKIRVLAVLYIYPDGNFLVINDPAMENKKIITPR